MPEQLASVLVPAAQQADGSYQVTIRLQPEQLGAVHVTLHLDAGTVSVVMHAEGGSTGDLLRQNLGQLRQQLSSAGLQPGFFQVTTGGPGTNSSGNGALYQPQHPAGFFSESNETTSNEALDVLDQQQQVPATAGSSSLDMRL